MMARALTTIIADLIIMFFISWKLTLITFAGVLLSSSCSFIFMMKLRDLSTLIQASRGDMTVTAEESYQNVRTVKAFANEEEESKKFRVSSSKVYDLGKRKALFSGLQSSLVSVALYCTLAAILYIAKLQFKAGEIRIGVISSFMLYIVSLIFQFWLISYAVPSLMGVLGASDRLVSIMNWKIIVPCDGNEDI